MSLSKDYAISKNKINTIHSYNVFDSVPIAFETDNKDWSRFEVRAINYSVKIC